ncbi:MAG: hypothetical protein LBF15_07000 [Candidatus Peribacteria bacterium]|jgi:magnesium-transporting ATPase (P-type)|nr:hypothetical protein [Candidatus Peribacteria bacterium]
MMLPKIKFILDGDKVRKITKKDIEILKEMNASLASKALRILAFAYKTSPLTAFPQIGGHK